ANAEFRHATDVDGYFHNLNLTTGGAGRHQVIQDHRWFCHPERSEGSAFCDELQIPRFARDDNS
ncbi:MAG TPA: hypothetical protein VJX30_12525, partial [Terriglobales bacterium]|nr:hypothetical protein [Terriglobales bacterium]